MDSRPGSVSDEELLTQAGGLLRGGADGARRILTAAAVPRGGGTAPTGRDRADTTTLTPTGKPPPFHPAAPQPGRGNRRARGGTGHGVGYLLCRRRSRPRGRALGGPERGACTAGPAADNPQSGGECGSTGRVGTAPDADQCELVLRCALTRHIEPRPQAGGGGRRPFVRRRTGHRRWAPSSGRSLPEDGWARK